MASCGACLFVCVHAWVCAGELLAEPPQLLHVPLEVQCQDYGATVALTRLLTHFLRRGYVAQVRAREVLHAGAFPAPPARALTSR